MLVLDNKLIKTLILSYSRIHWQNFEKQINTHI